MEFDVCETSIILEHGPVEIFADGSKLSLDWLELFLNLSFDLFFYNLTN